MRPLAQLSAFPEQLPPTTGHGHGSVFPRPAEVEPDRVPGCEEPWESPGAGLLNLALSLALRAWPRASDPPAPRAPCFRAQGSQKLEEPKVPRGFLAPSHPFEGRARGRHMCQGHLSESRVERSTAQPASEAMPLLTHSFVPSLICRH